VFTLQFEKREETFHLGKGDPWPGLPNTSLPRGGSKLKDCMLSNCCPLLLPYQLSQDPDTAFRTVLAYTFLLSPLCPSPQGAGLLQRGFAVGAGDLPTHFRVTDWTSQSTAEHMAPSPRWQDNSTHIAPPATPTPNPLHILHTCWRTQFSCQDSHKQIISGHLTKRRLECFSEVAWSSWIFLFYRYFLASNIHSLKSLVSIGLIQTNLLSSQH
jgi:hypothetical protein